MHEALRLLMWLQLWGRLRFFGRGLRTVKGAAFALLGAAVFAPWLFSLLLTPPIEGRVSPQDLLLYAPLGLLGMTVTSALFAFASQRAISFTPAEVNLLFPGPFSRRQLLGYKLTVSVGIGLIATPLVALSLRHYAASFVTAYVGLVLAIVFLQLFAMALALLTSVVGARAYNRTRQVLLLSLIAVVALAGFWAGKEALLLGPEAVLHEIHDSPMWQTVLAPFRWFVQAFLAERLWPDLVLYGGLGLAADLFLLVMIFALDAQYLEAAVASSERTYAQLERLRSGGMGAVGVPGSGKARFGLPSLPWWDGIGPNLWRQLLNAQRGFMPLVILLVFYAITLLPLVLSSDAGPSELGRFLPLVLTLPGVTIFLTTMIAYDFRPDIDRLDFLKTLPIAPSRLVIGQLAAPALLIGTLQLLVLTVAALLVGEVDPWLLLGAAAFAYPFNFLVFGMENLLFLWFPTRLMPSTPGDFQLMGRHILLMIAKLVGISVMLMPAVVVAALAFVITLPMGLSEWKTWFVVLTAGWLGLVAGSLALVPLLALAFDRFDVARDTPA